MVKVLSTKELVVSVCFPVELNQGNRDAKQYKPIGPRTRHLQDFAVPPHHRVQKKEVHNEINWQIKQYDFWVHELFKHGISSLMNGETITFQSARHRDGE
jgi:hypothetical protein